MVLDTGHCLTLNVSNLTVILVNLWYTYNECIVFGRVELLYAHLVLFGNSCVAVPISVKWGKMMGIQAKISSLLGSGSILWFSGVKWFPAPESLPVSKVNCSVKLHIISCRFPTKTRWLIPLQDGLHASFENSQHASQPGSNGVILQSAVLPGGTFVESAAAVAGSSLLLNARLIFLTLLLFWLMAAFYCSCPKRIEVLEVLHIISGIFNMHSSTASIFKVK